MEDFDLTLGQIRALDPSMIVPHGDRYIVEKLTINGDVRVQTENGIKTIKAAVDTNNQEERDGYYFARIVIGGDGYRMDTDVIVQMPYWPGDVVIVEKFSGRELKNLAGRTFTIVNQTDILAAVPQLGVGQRFSRPKTWNERVNETLDIVWDHTGQAVSRADLVPGRIVRVDDLRPETIERAARELEAQAQQAQQA